MDGIALLMEEHQKILAFGNKVLNSAKNVLEGGIFDIEEYRNYILFARKYADKHHHGKEELILFKIMQEKLEKIASKVIQNGMLVEHDLGRLFINDSEKALNLYEKTGSSLDKLLVLTNICSYVELLKRHIEKEDKVVYQLAKRHLSDEDIRIINEKTKDFEEQSNISDILKLI